MKEEILRKIVNHSEPNRDLVVDDLNDLIESGQLHLKEKEEIVDFLVNVLASEVDEATYESIMNLLGNVFFDGVKEHQISASIVSLMPNMKATSLIHALPIIASSSVNNKVDIIKSYCKHSCVGVSKTASELLRKNEI